MIADVAFEGRLPHPFSYRVPAGWSVEPGQRVVAPLRAAERVGVVVALREGDEAGLRPLLGRVDERAVLSPEQLALARWIADESLSALGSVCAAFLPPATSRGAVALSPALPVPVTARRPCLPELLIGPDREDALLRRISSGDGPALVVVADADVAARWAALLGRTAEVVRLDSSAGDRARATARAALAAGTARYVVGARAALLAPLRDGLTIALVDEHDSAHRPPGPLRMHARDVVMERARAQGLPALMTAATPSVEMWWRTESRLAVRSGAAHGAGPAVTFADPRGILRREPITPPLARAIRETLAARQKVFIGASARAEGLVCEDCGAVLRCPECAVALASARGARRLVCRLCSRELPLPDTCPACQGRRLSPLGWTPERVGRAVSRRFPHARVVCVDPAMARSRRRPTQTAAVDAADVVVGTRDALRSIARDSLGLAGFVAPDQLLRLPDFRAAERMLGTLWAGLERVHRDGRVVIQSWNPAHYALEAVARHDLGIFYRHELRFRAELGYPPFRRLAVVTVRAPSPADTLRQADGVAAALRAGSQLTVYPPIAARTGRSQRIVVKGHQDLPRQLLAALGDPGVPGKRTRGIIDVEVDPVEWPF
jgi:primosomal protein N'